MIITVSGGGYQHKRVSEVGLHKRNKGNRWKRLELLFCFANVTRPHTTNRVTASRTTDVLICLTRIFESDRLSKRNDNYRYERCGFLEKAYVQFLTIIQRSSLISNEDSYLRSSVSHETARSFRLTMRELFLLLFELWRRVERNEKFIHVQVRLFNCRLQLGFVFVQISAICREKKSNIIC